MKRQWISGTQSLGRTVRRPASAPWYSVEMPIANREDFSFFREDRAVAAARLFLGLQGGPLPLSRLMRLLYQLDRAAIDYHRTPVTYDVYEASPQGPRLVSTRRAIGAINAPVPTLPTATHLAVSKTGTREPVVAARDTEAPRALSKADERLAREVFERFAGLSQADYLRYLRENCPETVRSEGDLSFGMAEVMAGLGMRPELAAEVASMEYVRRHAA